MEAYGIMYTTKYSKWGNNTQGFAMKYICILNNTIYQGYPQVMSFFYTVQNFILFSCTHEMNS